MSRYIDADDLYNRLEGSYNESDWAVQRMIEDIVTEDVEPIIHAHWIHIKGVTPCCSNCGCCVEEKYIGYKRCPNCGAHMDEKVGE